MGVKRGCLDTKYKISVDWQSLKYSVHNLTENIENQYSALYTLQSPDLIPSVIGSTMWNFIFLPPTVLFLLLLQASW